jgi:hypothetical protein
MSRTKHIKGECQHCRGHLEFLVDNIGMVAACPHCGQQTELLLATPPEEPSISRKALVWTIVAVLILGFGLAASLVALKRAQRWAASRHKQQATPAAPATSPDLGTNVPAQDADAPNQFRVSAVTLEKSPGTSLIYAVGAVSNLSSKQRFGVRVELDLLDAAGQKLGTAKDYQQVIEPGAEWHFKALVVDSKAKSARLVSVKEDQ